MKKIKIAQTSDIHYCGKNLEEADRCLGEFVETCAIEKPNAIVLAGDSTEHRLEAHSVPFRALAQRVQQLSNIAPVLLLQGTHSHEPVGTIELLGLVGGKFPIAVANRVCQIALSSKGEWIYSESAIFHENELTEVSIDLVATCVPTISKASLAASLESTDNLAFEMGSEIKKYLIGVGVANKKFGISGIPTIGVSHGTVYGAKTEHGVPMSGYDHEYTVDDLFDANCSAFMLGHIHFHQLWERNNRYIGYAGSIGRYHYGEIGDKGYLMWTITATSSTPQFHKTSARQMKYYNFDGAPDLDVLKKEAENCRGFYVRVSWQIDQEHRQAVHRDQILEIFAEAAGCEVDIRPLQIQRTRAEGINRETTIESKLRLWSKLTEIDPEPLIERHHALILESSFEIASRIIQDIANFEEVAS